MTAVSENKMGTQPISKLLLTMSAPMVLSMVLQAFYNIVDSYFVSNMADTTELTGVGDYAMNALTLAFPIQMLMIAVGVGTGVGINSLLSRYLGEKQQEKVNLVAGNAITLGILTYIFFLIISVLGINSYIQSQTNNPMIASMAVSYLQICMFFSMGSILFMIYEKLLQGTGRTGLSMAAQLVGAILNIILDPILIFGYFGAPAMGVEGAALATVIGQIVSLLMGMLFHHKFNRDIHSNPRYFKLDKAVVKEIYAVGIPAIIMQALMSFMTYGINLIFGRISESMVTAYGIYYKIQQFVFFAAFGMNNALIPVAAFNYGMKSKKRVNQTITFGILYSVLIMLIGAILLQAFAHPLIGIFAVSAETAALCIRAIRIITIGYVFAGINIAYQGIFQAFGYGVRSLVVSLVRLILISLPLAYVLSSFANANTIIWWIFPIGEICAVVIAVLFMRRIAQSSLETLELENTVEKRMCQEQVVQETE